MNFRYIIFGLLPMAASAMDHPARALFLNKINTCYKDDLSLCDKQFADFHRHIKPFFAQLQKGFDGAKPQSDVAQNDFLTTDPQLSTFDTQMLDNEFVYPRNDLYAPPCQFELERIEN